MTERIELGSASHYPETYDPGLLESIPRDIARSSLSSGEHFSFQGVDIWTAYELSWLNDKGKPLVARAQFVFPCDSPAIIESKSFKYYLNSLNQTRFSTLEQVLNALSEDLAHASGAPVDVSIVPAEQEGEAIEAISGECIDMIDVDIDRYSPIPDLLEVTSEPVSHRQLYSHLLKSNCPVTGQPDWASLWIEYSGPKIVPASLLKYIVSFRQHQDFHENCVERIFHDIASQCQTSQLSVYARYTRRGGLDINPFRTSGGRGVPFGRLARQ